MKLNAELQAPQGTPQALAQFLYAMHRAIATKVNGLSSGTFFAVDGIGTAAPTTGTWARGDLIRNSAPVDDGSGGTILGWLCILGGTPGTWLPLSTSSGGGGGISDGDKGDITVSGSGATWTIDNDVVTFSKMQNMATTRVLGRKTGGSGDVEELTLSEVLDFIGSAAQGDILYRNGTVWTRLAAGTAGQQLKTTGSGGNPAWVDAPYIIAGAFPGIPGASEYIVLPHVVAEACTLAANFATCKFTATANAAASTVFDVQRNGISIGTATIGAGGVTCTFASTGGTAKSFNGTTDTFAIVGPATPDATLANPSFSMRATRD